MIALVNADTSFLEMMAEFLGDEGYDALILHENHQAYQIIKQRMPDLVLLEIIINNPKAGWMVLNKLRLDPQTTQIPVIVASTSTELIARNEQNLHAKRCTTLLKPFELEEFLTVLGTYALLSAKGSVHSPA